jgi:glutamate N-acetyltransferase/amino-acid N-acetyltransferase
MKPFSKIETSCGCLDTPGFKGAGVHCDVRDKADGRLDLALVVSETPCAVAGVFTRNRVAAAPVRLGREMLAKGGPFRGFVANSGNANACTGIFGMEDALAMQTAAAAQLCCDPGEIFICSTGRIGKRLPMDRIKAGIAEAAGSLGTDVESGLRVADAILTSDTMRKVCSVKVKAAEGEVHVSGMAKGAGMIEPNMATMLAFICTDAKVDPDSLQSLLRQSVETTFNAVTVDGDESTNDTVLLLANGTSDIDLNPESPDWASFKEAVEAVCQDLARKIVGDGEKITKVVEVDVQGAKDAADANLAARAIANSLLVKSSWYGNDPNWGRLMDALGYSGAELSEDSVQVSYAAAGGAAPVPVFTRGMIHEGKLGEWKAIVANAEFRILVDLGQGEGTCRVWSTDLTEGYVNFNKSE